MADDAAYLRIADDIRGKITSGELPPGAKLPSHAQIEKTYGVSSTTARIVVNMLKSEGIVEGRHGSGIYVRTMTRLVRDANERNSRRPTGSSSPFARDAAAAGKTSRWEHHSGQAAADQAIADRLHLDPGAPVMRTTYRYFADEQPIQISTSWEPLSITGGTPIERPEDGPVVGVIARMDTIGVRIDQAVEDVASRAATPAELEALGLSRRGAAVLVIERTYLASGRPVETADIVFASDRYQVRYRIQVD